MISYPGARCLVLHSGSPLWEHLSPSLLNDSQEGEVGSKVWNEVLMQNALHWDNHLSEGWGYTRSSDATLNSVYNSSLSFGRRDGSRALSNIIVGADGNCG